MISDSGDPVNPIWVILDEPYLRDTDHGYILRNCGYGFNFKKTWKLSGAPEPFITSLYDLNSPLIIRDAAAAWQRLIGRLHTYHPPLIVVLGDDLLNHFVPSTKQKQAKNSSLTKWAGSLLKSPLLNYDHYIIGSYTPDFVSMNWTYHEIQGYIDFGHVKDECDYFCNHGSLNPLPIRNIITNPTYDNVCSYLLYLLDAFHGGKIPYVSSDIETIRPA